MAYLFNPNIKRGLFRNNLNTDLRNRKSEMVPEILRGVEANFKRGGKAINLDNLDEMDEYDNRINEKKFWMSLIDPSSKKELEIVDKIKRNRTLLKIAKALISALFIFISLVEYELMYFKSFYVDRDPEKYEGLSIRVMYTIISITLDFSCCYYSFLLKREQKRIGEKSFWGSIYFRVFLIEAFIDIIHPIPGIDYELEIKILGQQIIYRLQTFLYALQFIKIYHILMLIGVVTEYTNIFSEKHCEHHGGESDTIFALKSVQKDQPFLILTISIFTLIIVFGIILRMFEILNIEGGGDKDFYYYTNGIWVIAVAMTTVGYGELFPKTHVGRFVVVISIFLGTFIISLTIVALQKSTEFNKTEMQAFSILKRLLLRKNLNEILIKLIQTNVRIFIMRRKLQRKTIIWELPEFMKLIRLKKYFMTEKSQIKRDMNKENFTSQEDKFLDLEPRIDQEIFSIKENLTQIREFKDRFEIQLEDQRKFIKKLDNSFDTTNKTKSLFNKLLLEENMLMDSYVKKDLNDNTNNLTQLKKLSAIERLSDIKKLDDIPNLINYSNLLNEDNEISKDDYEWEDIRSKELLKNKSKRTFDLLENLKKIKENNKNVTQKIKEEKSRKVKESSSFEFSNSYIPILDSPFTNLLSTIKGKYIMRKKHELKNKKTPKEISPFVIENKYPSILNDTSDFLKEEIRNKNEDPKDDDMANEFKNLFSYK